ncbi:MAG TPA: hypothetical protein VGR69_05045 [Candidatus Rubrimentiphilum sp.]|nr:hypothetical protein [Candidatus Rubrimentiphilum sp.]
MFKTRTFLAILIAASLTVPAAARMMSSNHILMQPSRFSGPGVYTGAPALPVTLSLIIAGGGPKNFNSVTLVKALTGSKFNAEVAKLTKQYGKTKVGNFLKVFNFVISDSLRIVTAKHIALPSTPSPDPKNAKALAAALWNAGKMPNGTFNVEVMLDRAVSHPIHIQVMKDIDAKYRIGQDADYHVILTTALTDLKNVYGL